MIYLAVTQRKYIYIGNPAVVGAIRVFVVAVVCTLYLSLASIYDLPRSYTEKIYLE